MKSSLQKCGSSGPTNELVSGQAKNCLVQSPSNQPYEGQVPFLNTEEKDANILLGRFNYI